jgi:ABC-type multidrug transport system permease subunit
MRRSPLYQLFLVHIREHYREPGTIFWAFIFPILTAWGLGVAFSGKSEQKKDIAIIENSISLDSNIVKHFSSAEKIRIASYDTICYVIKIGNEKTGTTLFRFVPCDQEEADKLLKHGNVGMVIASTSEKFVYQFDPRNSEAQLTYYQLINLFSKNPSTQIRDEIKPITQKGSRYVDFFIPGLMAMNLMMSSLWGISYSLIDRRKKKLLRRLVATPMKKTSFLFSLLSTRLVFNILESMILFVFGYYYFGITIEGSLLTFALLYLSGVFCFAGISILMASRTSNTYVGNGMINAVSMPMMLLSGIFFSYHNFPDVIIPYLQGLPLTMLADGFRGVFVEGFNLFKVLPTALILSAVGLVTFVTGLKIYKWY